MIEIGQLYIWKEDKDNPFKKDCYIVKVKDIKNGYVQYKNPGVLTHYTNSLTIEKFMQWFIPYNKERNI